eukprot:PITA_29677
MKLRSTSSETDPNHCSKVVDDRPLIPAPSEDDLFPTGANPLICRSKRELDSGCGMIGAKNILRYLRGTISHELRYTAENVKLHDYSNTNWGGSVEDRKSTSECWFSLGSASISWMSREQKSVAISTAETEYIATSMISCEAVWLWKLFSELFAHIMGNTMILCVNQGGDSIIEESCILWLLQHIDIRYYLIWDMVRQ